MWSYFKIILWGCVWFWIWLFTLPFRKNRHNCLTWAMSRYDDEKERGYLTIRWSTPNKFGMRWPHFGFLPEKYNVYVKHYIPKQDYGPKVAPDIWFEGQVKQGDAGRGEN